MFLGKNLWARKHALAHNEEWIGAQRTLFVAAPVSSQPNLLTPPLPLSLCCRFPDFAADDYEEEERERLYSRQTCLAKLVSCVFGRVHTECTHPCLCSTR